MEIEIKVLTESLRVESNCSIFRFLFTNLYSKEREKSQEDAVIFNSCSKGIQSIAEGERERTNSPQN